MDRTATAVSPHAPIGSVAVAEGEHGARPVKRRNRNAVTLTPHLAWCSGQDAASAQMRKAGRTAWNRADYNLAVQTQARLTKSLGAEREYAMQVHGACAALEEPCVCFYCAQRVAA